MTTCEYCGEEPATEVILNPNFDEKKATWDVCKDCKDTIREQQKLSLATVLSQRGTDFSKEFAKKLSAEANEKMQEIAERTKKPIMNAMFSKDKDGKYHSSSITFTGEKEHDYSDMSDMVDAGPIMKGLMDPKVPRKAKKDAVDILIKTYAEIAERLVLRALEEGLLTEKWLKMMKDKYNMKIADFSAWLQGYYAKIDGGINEDPVAILIMEDSDIFKAREELYKIIPGIKFITPDEGIELMKNEKRKSKRIH